MAGATSITLVWAATGLITWIVAVFFDPHGREILRLDSVTQFFRLRNVLSYMLSGCYVTEPNYLLWSSRMRKVFGDNTPQAQN